MRKLDISDLAALRGTLRKELSKSSESRFLHRLHCLILVGQGHSCHEVAEWFGIHPRTVERWINNARNEGLAGLIDADILGRPSKIDEDLLNRLAYETKDPPNSRGYIVARWNGQLLASYLVDRYGIHLGVRQCQRILKQLQDRE